MTAPPGSDYYQVLGVARAATGQEIKDAFLKWAAEYQAGGKPASIEAVERFRKIVRAYRILSNPEQRRHYDRLGENGVIDQPVLTRFDVDELEKWAGWPFYGDWPVNDWPADFIEYLKNRT